MTQAEREDIAQRLTQRGAQLPCPRCARRNFAVLDGYFVNPLQQTPSDLVLGGATVPTVAIVCTNCGFLSLHALGTLGLLPATPTNP